MAPVATSKVGATLTQSRLVPFTAGRATPAAMTAAAAPAAPPAEEPPPPPAPVVAKARAGPPPALVPALALGAAALLGRLLLGRRRGAASESGDTAPDVAAAPAPVVLEYSDVTCTLRKKNAPSATTLLQSVSGSAAPGRLTAIMGPSGAGKTCVRCVSAIG